MASLKRQKIETIGKYHTFMGLPKPQHPLVSVVRFEDITRRPEGEAKSLINNFYSIACKKTFNAKMTYGQQKYDFDEGIMAFIAPNQVISISEEVNRDWNHTGWLLMIHPDFLLGTPLAKRITQYKYFGYSINEALHLSEKEEITITGIMQNIAKEYQTNIDNFSQDVIIAQIELLLTYADRFYHRQFITRKVTNHEMIDRLEKILSEYFEANNFEKGLPSVQYIAEKLNVSPNYLGAMLKEMTGQSTQQHIHNKLIEKAKEQLSITELSVSEIAYSLGFEHPQSFSRLFKRQTNSSPLEFRNSFN